ncbi:hypothetical protein GCM10009630_55290 [Kribbella jejuensis]|uniref:Uncharacterized protein DUF4190 n=1 Tax=Kribbella jejuensis TaxID=236068 RepID=A0A542EW64_9ACTN|nr:DUF4190 domain-containing protein [Kribbella jejuensis]TQJ19557.1 uncharacterized protein DUF4190 [Kribbella jejuensis]
MTQPPHNADPDRPQDRPQDATRPLPQQPWPAPGQQPPSQPQDGQSAYGQQPSQPQYGQSQYGQQTGQPQYGQQTGQPQYGQQTGQPQYGQAGYNQQPSYGQPTQPIPGQSPYGQPYGQPQYGQASYAPSVYGGYGYTGSPGTNGLATASLICSLAGLLIGLSAPVGIVLGIIALSQIKKRNQDGKGMAIAGVIIGSVLTVGTILLFLFLIVLGTTTN